MITLLGVYKNLYKGIVDIFFGLSIYFSGMAKNMTPIKIYQ